MMAFVMASCSSPPSCEGVKISSNFAKKDLLLIEGISNFFHPIPRLGVETLPNSNSETRSGSASGLSWQRVAGAQYTMPV